MAKKKKEGKSRASREAEGREGGNGIGRKVEEDRDEAWRVGKSGQLMKEDYEEEEEANEYCWTKKNGEKK
jgi:hypothetical protein